jgi:hypothetical protein
VIDRERGTRGLSSLVRTVVCGLTLLTAYASARAVEEPPHSAELDAMIVRQAKRHGVPESLVRRIVMRESKYNPRARNHLYWGLMQISYPTAKSMGFKGSPSELLNPLVNLTYAVPYLANAFIIAGKRENEAVRLYASGYYFTARSRGLLGALRTADSSPMSADQIAELQRAAAESAQTDAAAQPVLQQIAQQDAAPPLPEHRPTVMPEGKGGKGDSVDMVLGRKGDAAPPKKWTHDGGVTRVARGDQPIEQIAAYGKAPDAVAITGEQAKLVHGHMQKTTLFAAIYRPTANAQAYAAASDGQDPRIAQAPSQAAIAEMTSGQATVAPEQTAETAPVAKTKSRARTARKAHAHETTRVARVDASDDEASKHRGTRRGEDAQASQAAPQ